MGEVMIANDLFTSGVTGGIFTPKYTTHKMPAVIYAHSASGDDTEAFGNVLPTVKTLLNELVKRGLTVYATTTRDGGNHHEWGNGVAQGLLNDEIAYARAHLSALGPVILMGTSAGSVTVLRWAGLNPGQAICVVTWLSIPNLTYAYSNNLGGNGPNIGTQYGVVYPAALPAGSDPNGMTFDCPIQLWHSTDDAYSATTAAPFAAAHPTVVDRPVGALGHTDASIAATVVPDFLDFVSAALRARGY